MPADVHLKKNGLTAYGMILFLLLLSWLMDIVLAVNEDGDTFQIKQNKHVYHLERAPRLTERVYGVPVTIDRLFEQIVSLPTDDQGQNLESECLNGNELAEMDMCLTPSQAAMFVSPSFTGQAGKRKRRQASANGFSLWKNGVIPYTFNSTFPSQDRDAILSAMAEWEKATCITFRPAVRDDTDIVVFRDGRRCSTNIGRIGGEQTVTLAKTCRSKRILIHELGHVIGLIHEHQRHDRDKFVQVLMENVRNLTQERYQFSKLLSGSITDKAVKYDYTSVMHYGRNYFARSPELTTLQTTESIYQDVIGRAEKPSFGDTETVNRLYKCSAGCPPALQCDESCYMDSICTCRCPAGAGKVHNGAGPFRNSLLDSTCEFFASRGECAGHLKDTVRSLCAKTCELHQNKDSLLLGDTRVQAPTSNINHLQSKPGGFLWGTSQDMHGLVGSGHVHINLDMNNLNDVGVMRGADTRLPPQLLHHQLQQQLPSQQVSPQDSQFLPLSDTTRLLPTSPQQLQQDIMNTPLTDHLRATLQHQVSQSSAQASLLRSLILNSSSRDKAARLFQPEVNDQQQADSQLNSLLRQKTTKTPSTILQHLLSASSQTRNDAFSGLSILFSLSHAHQQQHQQDKGPPNFQETPPHPAPSPMATSSQRQGLESINDLIYSRASSGISKGGTNNWQMDASFGNRNSERRIPNSQITDMRSPALADPYLPSDFSAMLPAGDFGRSEQGQKVIEINMGPVATGMDRPNGVVSSTDLIGSDSTHAGGSAPGRGITSKSNNLGDSVQNLQSIGPSFMKSAVLPQSLVVSDQNPPLGNPVEQVLNDPWSPQVQQGPPVTVDQSFQYYEPQQVHQNFDPFTPASGQQANQESPQQQVEILETSSNQRSSTSSPEQLGETSSFQNTQEPIDHQAVEASRSSPIVQSSQQNAPSDSSNLAPLQMLPMSQMVNEHQSFTDPLASMAALPGEQLLKDMPITELTPSQNLNNSRQDPGQGGYDHDKPAAQVNESTPLERLRRDLNPETISEQSTKLLTSPSGLHVYRQTISSTVQTQRTQTDLQQNNSVGHSVITDHQGHYRTVGELVPQNLVIAGIPKNLQSYVGDDPVFVHQQSTGNSSKTAGITYHLSPRTTFSQQQLVR